MGFISGGVVIARSRARAITPARSRGEGRQGDGIGRVDRVGQGKAVGRSGSARRRGYVAEAGLVVGAATGRGTSIEGGLGLLRPYDPNPLGRLASLAGTGVVAHLILLDS